MEAALGQIKRSYTTKQSYISKYSFLGEYFNFDFKNKILPPLDLHFDLKTKQQEYIVKIFYCCFKVKLIILILSNDNGFIEMEATGV